MATGCGRGCSVWSWNRLPVRIFGIGRTVVVRDGTSVAPIRAHELDSETVSGVGVEDHQCSFGRPSRRSVASDTRELPFIGPILLHRPDRLLSLAEDAVDV